MTFCNCCRAAAATVGSSVERWTRFRWRLTLSSPSCRLRVPVAFVIVMYLPFSFLERKRASTRWRVSPSGSRGCKAEALGGACNANFFHGLTAC